MKKGCELLFSLPKSFYVSWRLTSFKRALHLPVQCRYNVKVTSLCGRLLGGGNLHIGFNQTGIYDAKYQRSILSVSGLMVLNGNVNIGAGSRIEVGQGAVLTFDGKVANSAGVTLVCGDRITIGDNTVISWDTLIIDTDFHFVLDTEKGTTRPMRRPIVIGKETWLCVGSKILKGSKMPDGCILSAGSILNKKYEEHNCLLAGNPAIIARKNVKRSDEEVKIFESKK